MDLDLERIGPYRIVRKLGQGGMGAVYEAVHEEIARSVAIKVLHSDGGSHPELTARFLNEARAVNIIRHRSIVGISDLGRLADGTPYIVMEHLDGVTLRRRSQSGLPHLAVLRLLRQVASALAAAHEKGIIHRDLKPDNVMVVRDPEVPGEERAIILDFGIAKLAEEHKHPETVGQHTDARVTVGTATYMSPEQAALERSITDRTDVYALGVVLYELLSGAPPFAAGNYALLLDMHRFSAAVPLERSVPGLSPRLTELVHRMLAKEPQARPGMAKVAAELEEVLRAPEGELAGGRPATAGAEPTPPIGRTDPVAAPPGTTTDLTTHPTAELQETTRRNAPGEPAAEPTAPLLGAQDGGPKSEAATTRKRLVPSGGAELSLSDRGVRALVAGLAIAVVLALLLGIWLGRIS